jgi:hypothetical protein
MVGTAMGIIQLLSALASIGAQAYASNQQNEYGQEMSEYAREEKKRKEAYIAEQRRHARRQALSNAIGGGFPMLPQDPYTEGEQPTPPDVSGAQIFGAGANALGTIAGSGILGKGLGAGKVVNPFANPQSNSVYLNPPQPSRYTI